MQQHHPQQQQQQQQVYYQRSRSESRRPKLPWNRSRSLERDRDRSHSPSRISSPTWTEPRSPLTIRSSWNHQALRDTGTQTVQTVVGKDDGGYFEIKSYFHRSRVHFRKNRALADVTCQVSGQTAEPSGSNATVSRNDSLFRRIRNLSEEVQQIQDIVDSRQVSKTSYRHSMPPEDSLDYIQSVDTLLNEKQSRPTTMHTADTYTEGTVKVKVGDYRNSNSQQRQTSSQQNRLSNSHQQNGTLKTGTAAIIPNGSSRSSSYGRYYQSQLSKSTPSPAVFVTPPTPEATMVRNPLSTVTNNIYGNYGRARSVVDGDFEDYPDNRSTRSTSFAPKAKSMAGSLRLSVGPNGQPQNHSTSYTLTPVSPPSPYTTASDVRFHTTSTSHKSYPVPIGRVGAVVSNTGTSSRLYRPIERVYFPHGAPSDIRRRAHSAPRPRY